MLNTATAGTTARRANGRVSRTPIGTATSRTTAVETTVSVMCWTTAGRMNSQVTRRSSMLSRVWLPTYRARATSTTTSTAGVTR